MIKAYLTIAIYTFCVGYIGHVIGFWLGVKWYKRIRDKTDSTINGIQQSAINEPDSADWWKRN